MHLPFHCLVCLPLVLGGTWIAWQRLVMSTIHVFIHQKPVLGYWAAWSGLFSLLGSITVHLCCRLRIVAPPTSTMLHLLQYACHNILFWNTEPSNGSVLTTGPLKVTFLLARLVNGLSSWLTSTSVGLTAMKVKAKYVYLFVHLHTGSCLCTKTGNLLLPLYKYFATVNY